jgi:galactose oxidase
MMFSNKHGWSRLKIGLCLLVLYLGLSSNAAAQNDVVGRWSRFADLPFYPAHSHVLPNSKVMIWGAFALGTEARLWDPATATVSPVSTPHNIFCSGHAFLADGRLFVAGGHIDNDVGLPNAGMYNPFTDQWSQCS